MAQYDKGFLIAERAKEIERNFMRTVRYLGKKGIPVYVKLSGDGKIMAIAVDPEEVAKGGYTKIN
jgi:hypothetical protein